MLSQVQNFHFFKNVAYINFEEKRSKKMKEEQITERRKRTITFLCRKTSEVLKEKTFFIDKSKNGCPQPSKYRYEIIILSPLASIFTFVNEESLFLQYFWSLTAQECNCPLSSFCNLSSFIFLVFFLPNWCKRHFWKSENFGPEKAHEKLSFGID